MAYRWTMLLRAGHRPATGRGQSCSASALVETGTRLVRAIRELFVWCLAIATDGPVENSSGRDLLQSEI